MQSSLHHRSAGTPSGHGGTDARGFRDGDLALVAAVGLQVLEFFYSYPATVLKIILVSLCSFPGRAAYLPAILVCQFFASDFLLQEFTSYEYLLERHEEARVFVLGFPVTTNYAFALCLTLRVLHEAVVRPRTFAGIISPWWLALWASCFIPAVLAALLGKVEQKFSWTAPVRDVMMVGCLFYGMLISRNKAETIAVISRRLVPMASLLITLAMFGYFYSRGMYFVAAFGPALFLSRRAIGGSPARWLVFGYYAALATCYAFALYPTAYGAEVAKSLYSTSGNSFALVAAWGMAVAISLFLPRLNTATAGRQFLVSKLPVVAGLVAMLFPIVFALASYSFTVDLPRVKDIYELNIRDRFMYKLFYDRAPIWRGALDEVLRPPYFLKSGGLTAGYKLMLNGDQVPWPAGSHSLVLEELKRNGWYTGLICLILIIRANVFSLRAVLSSADPLVRAFAIGSFSSLFVLTLTSHIPMETNAALWALGLAGMCAYLVQGGRTAPARSMALPTASGQPWLLPGQQGAFAR